MTRLHLALALDVPDVTAAPWVDLIVEAERGLLDLVTIEDSLAPPGTPGAVAVRVDAALVAARVAPLTSRIGLVPTVTTTYTEPFHVASAIATLDYVSTGRAGWRPRVSFGAATGQQFGRVAADHIDDLFAEAGDAIEVVRRLWDSWEDDAIIRDVATGRFVDNRKLHYIDFEGRFFSVKGPSIVPRPPQGQPVVAVLAHTAEGYALAAAGADVVFVTPSSAGDAARMVGEVRAAETSAGRTGVPLKVFADLLVFLGERPASLPESDAHVFAGSVAELADLLTGWQAAGVEGFRLRPGVPAADARAISGDLTAVLRERGLFRTAYPGSTLRDTLGLGRPANRYATVGGRA